VLTCTKAAAIFAAALTIDSLNRLVPEITSGRLASLRELAISRANERSLQQSGNCRSGGIQLMGDGKAEPSDIIGCCMVGLRCDVIKPGTCGRGDKERVTRSLARVPHPGIMPRWYLEHRRRLEFFPAHGLTKGEGEEGRRIGEILARTTTASAVRTSRREGERAGPFW